jgi:hypothetical protein
MSESRGPQQKRETSERSDWGLNRKRDMKDYLGDSESENYKPPVPGGKAFDTDGAAGDHILVRATWWTEAT